MKNPSKEQQEEWAESRRLHFAWFCWLNQNKGMEVRGEYLTWEQIFDRNEGILLREYARVRMAERRQQRRKESESDHNKSGDQTSLPL